MKQTYYDNYLTARSRADVLTHRTGMKHKAVRVLLHKANGRSGKRIVPRWIVSNVSWLD